MYMTSCWNFHWNPYNSLFDICAPSLTCQGKTCFSEKAKMSSDTLNQLYCHYCTHQEGIKKEILKNSFRESNFINCHDFNFSG